MTAEARPSTMGLAAAALAATLWGFGGIFVALTGASGLAITFFRLWLGAVLLTMVTYATGRRLRRSTVRATWLAGLFLAGDMAMFYCAIKLTSIVDVTVIGSFQPALVLLPARRMFAERLSRWDVTWIMIAVIGVLIAVFGPAPAASNRVAGDLLALGSLVSFSAYWLVTKRARERHDALVYTNGVTLVAALALTPVVVISGVSLGQVRASDWIWIALLALVPGGGHLMMNWAQRFVDASISSAISCLSPLVAATVAIPILGQSLTISQVAGVLVGLSAIAVLAVRRRLLIETLIE